MEDLNKQEFELLNNYPCDHSKEWYKGKKGKVLYNIAKICLWFVYGLTCIICTIAEAVCRIICIAITRKRRKKRRKKGWF